MAEKREKKETAKKAPPSQTKRRLFGVGIEFEKALSVADATKKVRKAFEGFVAMFRKGGVTAIEVSCLDDLGPAFLKMPQHDDRYDVQRIAVAQDPKGKILAMQAVADLEEANSWAAAHEAEGCKFTTHFLVFPK